MTRLLTIDTSGLVTQVAIALDGVLLNQKKARAKRASQSVLRLVSEILRESNVSLRQVDAMCVVTGPGSFTGLRVGVGVAQGLSSAQEIPLLGISTLALHAKSAFMLATQYDQCIVSMNAREGEVYVGRYEMVSGSLQLHGDEFVLNLSNDFKKDLEDGQPDLVGVGDGWQREKQITNILGIKLKGEIINNGYRNKDIIDLASQKFKENNDSVNGVLLPNYVKDQLDYS
jgi:tRNA threonylcarbamoyladenosine biosynthesis protein TsaB